MYRFTVLIFFLALLNGNIYAHSGGGGGGENGGQNDGYQSLDAPPVMPPSINPVDMKDVKDMFENEDFKKLSEKNTREMEKIIRRNKKIRIRGQQKMLERKQDEADIELGRAERNDKIARTVGYLDAGAAAIVGAIASGGAAATIGTISAVSDGIAGAAGSLSNSYQNKTSIAKAIKDATVEGLKKGIFSKFISISKFGGKTTSALANFTSGQLYDYTNNSAKNLRSE